MPLGTRHWQIIRQSMTRPANAGLELLHTFSNLTYSGFGDHPIDLVEGLHHQ